MQNVLGGVWAKIRFIKKPKIHFISTEGLNDQLNTITCALFKVYNERYAETDIDKCEMLIMTLTVNIVYVIQ